VTEYVGLPLLVFLVMGIWWARRDLLAQLMVAVGVVSFVLTLGPRLILANHHTSIIMPYAIMAHLPVIGDIMPSRLAIGMWFAIAVLTALTWARGLERLRTWLQPADVQSPRRLAIARASLVLTPLVVAAVTLAPLLPSWPYAQSPAEVPAFFTSSSNEVIPPGSLALTYPYPITSSDQPMLWQAETGMRFRLLGGYVIAPDDTGAGTFFADGNNWEYCLLNISQYGTTPSSLCASAALAQTLGGLGIHAVVVDQAVPNSNVAASLVAGVVGAPPQALGGVWLWLWRCSSSDGTPVCAWT